MSDIKLPQIEVQINKEHDEWAKENPELIKQNEEEE